MTPETLTADERARARVACAAVASLMPLPVEMAPMDDLLLRALDTLDAADARIAELEKDNAFLRLRLGYAEGLLRTVDTEPNRCHHVIKGDRCGRDKGHEGKCCWARGD